MSKSVNLSQKSRKLLISMKMQSVSSLGPPTCVLTGSFSNSGDMEPNGIVQQSPLPETVDIGRSEMFNMGEKSRERHQQIPKGRAKASSRLAVFQSNITINFYSAIP